jgi:thiosulfate reductase cytochrome b subunit
VHGGKVEGDARLAWSSYGLREHPFGEFGAADRLGYWQIIFVTVVTGIESSASLVLHVSFDGYAAACRTTA